MLLLARLLSFARVLVAKRTLKILVLAAVFLVFGLGLPSDPSETSLAQTDPPPDERPNMILILADDLDARTITHMPALQSLLVQEGTSFSNAFVTDSLCCPSRASILLGQYTHNHQVLTNAAPLGGFEKFRSMGHENSTIATGLRSNGYQTALIGKYLNGYAVADPTYVPPGWDEWYATLEDSALEERALNENGTIVPYNEGDHQTDVLARKATDYVGRAAEDGRPFFMYLTPTDPHQPFTPAARHEGAFAGEKWPRSPSFNEADVSDKPSWVRNRPLLTPDQIAQIDEWHRGRLREMLAVDEMISGIVESLRATGELENTYILFNSDNGFHLGEHRLGQLVPNKHSAYEEDIRVPLLVRGPGVPTGRVLDQFALNIDFAPTFAQLGGVSAPATFDGRSLVPLLGSGTSPTTWRSSFLAERWTNTNASYAPTYDALRTKKHKYVRYANGERELYDLSIDPYELKSLHDSARSGLKLQLESQLVALDGCAGESCRAADDCTVTGTSGNDVLQGTSGEDVICGLGGNDTLRGLGGNDILKGGDGLDTLLGGTGGDTLDGGGGTDTASYSVSATAVVASLATGTATGEGSDSFKAIENLTGSPLNDALTGSSGANSLSGGGGADTLRGGSGNDSVVGGGGADKLFGEVGNDAINSKDGVSGNDSLDGGAGSDTKVTDATEASIIGFP